jgi:DDE superfamily endonuclease
MAWAQAGAGAGERADQARERLAGFRRELYRCLGKRADALLELADAVLCKQGRVQMLAELSLEPGHQRGHGALYDGLNCGSIQIARLRWALAAVPLPGWDDGRIRLAVDVSNWLRPDAVTSPGRSFCHCYGRGKNSAQMIPGWPYSFIGALEPGRTSWVRLLDAVRLTPDDDLAAVTAVQVREVIGRIIAAGHWHDGDPDILVIFDAGYEPARLAWLLADLPVQVLGRLGTNRVLRQAPPPRRPGQMGAPVRHGRELKLSDDAAGAGPDVRTTTQTSRYGTAHARAWHRMHPKLKARGAWEGHQGELPVIEGTLIKLTVDHLPHDHDPKPVWLWTSRPDADPAEADRCWQAFLRRFDIEHTFRFLKQALGWTRPKLRHPAAADRWTWLILACHAQLWLARTLAADLRLPWQHPAPPGRLTPARVRRGFRAIHGTLPVLTAAPKPGKPGPGRPPGSKNRHPATRYDVARPRPIKRTPARPGRPRPPDRLNGKLSVGPGPKSLRFRTDDTTVRSA